MRVWLHAAVRLLLCSVLVGSTPFGAAAADMSSVAALAKPTPGGLAWTASEISELQRTVRSVLSGSALRGAEIGFLAIDTVRGTPLYAQNANREFVPASNFKLLVGSTALRNLGVAFAYVTTVNARNTPVNGTLTGNLYLRGGGDALLSTKNLDDAAASLATAGIKRVDGAVVADASYFDDQRWGYGWSWDDLPYYYAPVVSALELQDGIVHVFMTPGATQGFPVDLRVEPASGAYAIDNRLVTGPPGSKDTSEIVRPWNEPRTIELTGSYPIGAKTSEDLAPSVPDPQSCAGDVFLRALQAHGITVMDGSRDGVTPAGAEVLWLHNSEPMPQLLADFWYPSDNLMGELLLKQLGVLEGGQPGTDANGILLEQQYLRSIGVDPSSVTISDGSGLSEYDRITPSDLVAILQSDWNAPYRDAVLNALPVSGVRGTLRHEYVGTPAERVLFAKTGSVNHVRTISGFIQTSSHGPITFSLLINQWMDGSEPGGIAALAKLRAALFTELAAQ